jgi:hypothetical protein
MPKEKANPYFGRKSFGGKGLGPKTEPSQAEERRRRVKVLRKKFADRTKVVAIILGAKNAHILQDRKGKITASEKVGKNNLRTTAMISLNPKGGYTISGSIAVLSEDNKEIASTPFEGTFKSFTAMARGHIARQVAMLKKAKGKDAEKLALKIAGKDHINTLITRANKYISESDSGLSKIPEFKGNATARPQYEGASMKKTRVCTQRASGGGEGNLSPWSKPERMQDTSGLFNPLLDLIPEKIKPDTAPLSPTNRKPMIAAFVGPAKGPKTRVWISPEERVCLPRLRGKSEE